jgi:internalin A
MLRLPTIKPGRRRFIISLRGLMVAILILGVWMGWIINRAESRRKAVATLERNGAIVLYDYESMRGVKAATTRQWAPAWLRTRLGDDYFQSVTYANLTPNGAREYVLADRDLAPLQALDRLDVVELTDTPITDAGLTYLEGLNLTSLVLANIDPAEPNVHVTDAGLACLRGMTRLRNLELIGTDVSDAGLKHLGQMTGLESLGLPQTKVTGAGLAHLGKMAHLKSLRLFGTPMTDVGLGQLRGMVSLQDLRLGGTRTTDAGLANLAGLTMLRRLDLGTENCSDAGLAHLAGLTSLQELSLEGARITDAGLVHLAGLQNVRELHIDSSSITDLGLVHLRGLANLRVLSLVGAKGVTDAGLTHLRGLVNLRALHVDFTAVSDEGIKGLQRALPTLGRTTNRKPTKPTASPPSATKGDIALFGWVPLVGE